jgi:hypothetical protein
MNHGRGQPSKFKPKYVEQVRELCEAGFTDEQIAACLCVHRCTLHRWQVTHPDFFAARAIKHAIARQPPGQRRMRA